MRIESWLWGGGAAAGLAAEYADLKMRPFSANATNSELVALLALATDAFGWLDRNPNYNKGVDGAAGWAAGQLTQGIARRRMLIQPAPAPTPPAPSSTPAKTTPPASSPSGPTGIPAGGGSAAFDLPMGGY
jgi:hypothetical protein